METPEKTRVAVVFGGGSTEHAVTSVGAADVLSALAAGDEFEIVPIGVTGEGRWVLSGGASGPRALTGTMPGTDLVTAGDDVAVVEPRDGVARLQGIDVVFPVLQGAFGTEGTLQGLLEMADLPYVGSGVFASSAAMDHDYTRKLAVAAGLPVAPYAVLRAGQALGDADRARIGLPAVVRPAHGHHATVLTDWDGLDEAVAAAREADPKVIVAAAPQGRRITVGVLEGAAGTAGTDGTDGSPQASVPGELPATGPGAAASAPAASAAAGAPAAAAGDEAVAGVVAPAELERDVERSVRELAVRAFVALDCAGLARVDFTVTPAGDVTLDRIDTMPGFEPGSPFPVVWQASGVTYHTLVARLIRAAVRRGTGLH